jgi:hypothetical protein
VIVPTMKKKASGQRQAKILLGKKSASEILAAHNISPAEQRRARAAVAAAKRRIHRVSASEKRASSSKRRAASRAHAEAK